MGITRQKYDQNTIHTITQLGIWDSRLLASTDLKNPLNADKAEVLYPVNILKYAELCGNIENNIAQQRSKAFDMAVKAAKKLQEFPLEIHIGENAYYSTSIIHSYFEERSANVLAINFDPLFLPLITGHMKSGQFYMPVIEMHTLSSPYKISMYHLIEKELWRLKEDPYFVISMATIRKALKIEDKYPRTNTVVDRFIKPTLEELSKITKYNLDYKVVKGTIRFSYKLNIVEV